MPIRFHHLHVSGCLFSSGLFSNVWSKLKKFMCIIKHQRLKEALKFNSIVIPMIFIQNKEKNYAELLSWGSKFQRGSKWSLDCFFQWDHVLTITWLLHIGIVTSQLDSSSFSFYLKLRLHGYHNLTSLGHSYILQMPTCSQNTSKIFIAIWIFPYSPLCKVSTLKLCCKIVISILSF